MEWFNKHVDAVMVIGAIIASMLWMQGQFSEIQKDMSIMKTEMAVIKTVMLMKQILPSELAKREVKE